MKIVQIFEAKTQLSKLVEAVETGSEKEVIIARHGRPVARLVGLRESIPPENRIGVAKGIFSVPPEIEEENERIVALFQESGAE
jgi:prevent-host-death family protein